MKTFGIIGYPLSHSFSKKYFEDKFLRENISDFEFRVFEMENVLGIRDLIATHPNIVGLSVTIPHKEIILNYLDEIDEGAKKIGAVNCIKISHKNNKPYLSGFNTDTFGFENSLKPLLKNHHKKALILGTGGAAKAVAFTLDKLGIEYLFITRKPTGCKHIRYSILHEGILNEHTLIINTTPLGMFPDIDSSPDIPYQFLSEKHLLFDLTYNPTETLFLKKGKEKGATIKNGLEMLHLQAEKAYGIWNPTVLWTSPPQGRNLSKKQNT